jgi:hypothetical protein
VRRIPAFAWPDIVIRQSMGTAAMSKHLPRALRDEVRRAGYRLLTTEQLRTNRWLLLLIAPGGTAIALLVQMRSLIHASDVLDLAEMIQLRRVDRAILWAYGGQFSAEAYRTLKEVASGRIQLCSALPPAVDTAHVPTGVPSTARETLH